jgi:hypothetical protein
MNIYYTAKDVEELAASGRRQLTIGPGVFLTDFARETAQQLEIELVDGSKQATPGAPATPTSSSASVSDRFNKPSGCMHASPSLPAAPSAAEAPANRSSEGAGGNTVNRLIDLMGKAIKRGE